LKSLKKFSHSKEIIISLASLQPYSLHFASQIQTEMKEQNGEGRKKKKGRGINFGNGKRQTETA